MEEGESSIMSGTADTDARPQTARKDSGNMPAANDAALDGSSSVFSSINDEPGHERENHEPFTANARLPSLDLTNLPSLPPADMSFVSNQSDAITNSDGHMDTIDEREMRRHLMNIESSFLPVHEPVVTQEPGRDDTFLFDAEHRHQQSLVSRPSGTHKPATVEEANDEDSAFALPSPPNSSDLPDHAHASGSVEENSLGNVGNTTSSLESMSSSPTAAAAARTISRAISGASAGHDIINNEISYEGRTESQEEAEREMTPKRRRHEIGNDGDSSDERSTVRYKSSNNSLDQYAAADAGNTPGAALLHHRSSGKRPKFLRSRNASQRSSVSSFITNQDSQDGHSDHTGADYALQSGGAVPEGGMSRNASYALSRSISLGSIASNFDDSAGSDFRGDRALATLEEEERNRERNYDVGQEENLVAPETPRPSNQSLAAPTDTIIARHVRNVQVPESMAKEYRTKNQVSSPSKTSTSMTMGRTGKNLTLKEQSSTIERLLKENFDLKLKVMFLSDRLDKLSEEGVKEMISENVDLKTALANIQRDNKALRRKVKELEQKAKDGSRPGTARSGGSSGDRSPTFDQDGISKMEAQEREEELFYLRERVEEYVTEIEKLRQDGLAREAEKRKMAETVRAMGERRGETFETREEMDVWKDLLEQETSRREQADEDNRKLRDEIFRLKSEATQVGGATGLNHTTNIYNITKKRQISPSRPRSGMSERVDERTGTFSAASTLVEELRKESDQLRHENAELRREVGAQTSMLTSRNREKERLYQEIEDLRLGQRRGGGSIGGDSILERSASRAHDRSPSRNITITKQIGLADSERDEFENKNAELRDKINVLRLNNQELQRELDSCMQDFEEAVAAKTEAEAVSGELQEEITSVEADLQTMQAERDEALRGQEDLEIEFENLRREAQGEIDALEEQEQQKVEEFEKLQAELADQNENFNALNAEMRSLGETLVRLEDDHDAKSRRIQELEQEVNENNRELEELEANLAESNEKVDRLTVQQQSNQGEIAFLREEQESDKVKIGSLETALQNAELSIREQKEREQELEQRIIQERQQREHIAGKKDQEVQKHINDMNRDVSASRDEVKQLRKKLRTEQTTGAEWRGRLTELEGALRLALGDIDGTKSSLLKSVETLQRELENTRRELESTRSAALEKDRLIKQRDGLLESHGIESRKLSEMLDKERQSHRNTKHQYDSFQKSAQHTTRTASQQEARVLELETSRAQDRKKISQLENTFKDQLTERNNLLLVLWGRLSGICGSDWTHNNSLINNRALPSLDTVTNMLPGFSKNLLAAVKNIESVTTSFQARIKTVEHDLWKEYQTLEHSLEMRTKKLDRLETLLKSGVSNDPADRAELVRLRDANRQLKAELASLRNVDNRTRNLMDNTGPPSPSPSVPMGPRHKSNSFDRTSMLTRSNTTSAVDTIERAVSSAGTSKQSGLSGVGVASMDEAGEQRWIYRLRELERRLKAEREARLLDRHGARRRLEEGEKRNEELRAELERNQIRKETALH